MDERWGLAQMEKGARNSAHHARQQSRGERRAREAGLARAPRFETDLDHVRRVVRESVEKVAKGDEPNKMRALSAELDRRGVHMRMSRDKSLKRPDIVFEYRPTYDRRGASGRRVGVARISGHKLGRGFSMSGIRAASEASRPRDQEGGREGGLSGHRRGDGGGPLRAGKRGAIHGLETAGPLGALPFDHIRRLIEKGSCPLPPCHSFCCPPGHPRRH